MTTIADQHPPPRASTLPDIPSLTQTLDPTNPPDRPGLLAGLCGGKLHWPVTWPFPVQDAADRAAGDQAIRSLHRLLRAQVDPEQVEATRALPDALLDQLRRNGYLALRGRREQGGLGLTFPNAFRVVEAAMSWSVPVGWCLAIHNGLGAAAYLPLLPVGPLHDLITRRVAAGALCGDADTEPSGASNESRTTTATLTADGSAYLIDGEKICIGNGPLADFVIVSATVTDADGARVEYFFLDTTSPGFTVRSRQEFLGLKGAAIAALTFDRVRVPADQLLTLPDDVDTELEVNRPARLYIVSAPALALTRLCAHWSREFVNRRRIDGQPLGSYDAIQVMVAATLADLYAIETVVDWCLLGEDRQTADDFRLEQSAAKNITSTACWRVVDRTVSLLAAEGLETAASKAARGAQPLPVERAFRDARALRVAGGVDFLLDKYFGETVVLSRALAAESAEPAPAPCPPELSDRNQHHLRFVHSTVAAFPDACRRSRRNRSDSDQVPMLANQIANELLTMTLTLARTASLADARPETQDLADIYCTAARQRIATWQHAAGADDAPGYRRLAHAWLAGAEPHRLLDDLLRPDLSDLPAQHAAPTDYPHM